MHYICINYHIHNGNNAAVGFSRCVSGLKVQAQIAERACALIVRCLHTNNPKQVFLL